MIFVKFENMKFKRLIENLSFCFIIFIFFYDKINLNNELNFKFRFLIDVNKLYVI